MTALLYNIKKIYAVTLVLQLAVMLGIILGYTAYLFPQWEANGPPFDITNDTESLVATTSVCLRPLGALLDTVVVDKIGRRGTLRVVFLFLTLGWILTGLAFNLEMFLVGRALSSLVVGMVTSVTLYISEISSDDSRATILAFISPVMTLGIAFTYVLMLAFHWRVTAFIIAGYSLLLFLSMYTIPETAYWYVMNGRRQEAARTLKWFANDNNDNDKIEEQLKILEETGRTERGAGSKWKMFRQPAIISRFFVLMLFINLLHWTGYLVVPNYALNFFRSMRSDFDDSVSSIIFGFLCFFCDIILILTVNKFKRRSFIIWCGTAMVACMTITIGLQALGGSHHPNSLWPLSDELFCRRASVFTVFAYFIFSHFGFNEMIWIIIPELFPTVIRATAFSMFCFMFFVSMLYTFYIFPILLSYFGFIFIGTIFNVCTVAIVLITVFFIPETRNISLYGGAAAITNSGTTKTNNINIEK